MPDTQSTAQPAAWKFWRWKLHWQILLGLLVGSIIGYISAKTALTAAADAGDAKKAAGIVEGRGDYLIYSLIGDMFLNGLKLIIVPLATSSIILAVAGLGAQKGFGRLGGKTLAYYLTTSLIAIMIGLLLVNIVKPGLADNATTGETQGILQGQDMSTFTADFAKEQGAIDAKAKGKKGADFLNVFREMIPANVFDAAAKGKLLGLIIVSLFVGYFMVRINADRKQTLLNFVSGVYDVTLRITDLVLRFAPLGVCALIAGTVALNYAKLAPEDRFKDFAAGITTFAITALAALLIHFLVIMPVILCLIAKVNPLKHYKAMAPALMTAFSTASSSATLPVTMECVEERAGVSKKTTSFVLPLGATVNMDGTALYECVAAIFICQAFGVDLTISQQFFVVVVALLTSVGVAGVPSASIVAIVVILQAISGQPDVKEQLDAQGIASLTAGLGLIWVFDRPLDMCRTAVNIFSDSVGAVVVARTEGEADVLTGEPPTLPEDATQEV
jgi:proton glutamate symport protein